MDRRSLRKISFQSQLVSLLGWSASDTFAANSTSYIGPFSSRARDSTEANFQWICPVAGTMRNLYLFSTDPGGSAQSYVFTLRVNGSDSALTATISTGSTTGSDLVNRVKVAAGDRITMKIVASATAGADPVQGAGWEFVQ